MTEGLKQGLRGRLREHIDDVFYIAQCLEDSESGDIDPERHQLISTYIDAIIDIACNVAEENKRPPKPYKMWARKCDATGKGMNEGYVFGDGEKYFALEMHALEYAQSIGYKNLDDAYDYRAFYWTEWEQDRDYIEIDGKVIEFEK
jgi:hypothetical protein